MKPPLLRRFRVQNFKAVRDSGVVAFTPLTVFIGNNGSGKSSMIEALEMLHTLIRSDLDRAMQDWRGFEFIRYAGYRRRVLKPKRGNRKLSRQALTHPMGMALAGRIAGTSAGYLIQVNCEGEGGQLYIQKERLVIGSMKYERDEVGNVVGPDNDRVRRSRLQDGASLVTSRLGIRDAGFEDWATNWQFLLLNPQRMGEPHPAPRSSGQVVLAKDGSNIAEYLLDIRKRDQAAFEGILEALQHILPYAQDIQPALTSELGRNVYLQLTEAGFKLPGWLLSTGTLRLLALLAVLRHPTPPPLVVVEEIENGLDPRTIHLVVEEIRNAVEGGQTQIIITTHSPYLLDLLSLLHVVVVDRVDDQPTFSRPADEKELLNWSNNFAPGELYTMGRLRKRG